MGTRCDAKPRWIRETDESTEVGFCVCEGDYQDVEEPSPDDLRVMVKANRYVREKRVLMATATFPAGTPFNELLAFLHQYVSTDEALVKAYQAIDEQTPGNAKEGAVSKSVPTLLEPLVVEVMP